MDGVHFKRCDLPARCDRAQGARGGALRPRRDGRGAGRGLRAARAAGRHVGGRARGRRGWTRRRRPPSRSRGCRAATWSASPVLFLAVTVVGHEAENAKLVTRNGAVPGDALLLTGPLGAAAAGLLLLEDERLASAVDPETAEKLCARASYGPRRVTEAGLALARAGASAMIDVSDGLGADAAHLASASGVRCLVELSADLLAPGVSEVAVAAGNRSGRSWRWAARTTSCLPPCPRTGSRKRSRPFAEPVCDPALAGRVEAGEGVVLRGPTGREVSGGGFDQVRSRVRGEPT